MAEEKPNHKLTEKYITEAIIWAINHKDNEVGSGIVGSLTNMNERAKISGLALAYIMSKRQGTGCGSKELAYADHYFQSRMMVGYTGLVPVVRAMVLGYEAKKKYKEMTETLSEMASDKQCSSPVPPDLTSIYYGGLGVEHGRLDFFHLRNSEVAFSIDFWKTSVSGE